MGMKLSTRDLYMVSDTRETSKAFELSLIATGSPVNIYVSKYDSNTIQRAIKRHERFGLHRMRHTGWRDHCIIEYSLTSSDEGTEISVLGNKLHSFPCPLRFVSNTLTYCVV